MNAPIDLVALRKIQTGVGTIQKGSIFRAFSKDADKYIAAGDAELYSQQAKRKWGGFRWDGAEVAILASGGSMSKELAETVHVWRDKDRDKRKVIVVNSTHKLAPWADVLYVCDQEWWLFRKDKHSKSYYEEVKETFKGQLWTQAEDITKKYDDVNYIPSRRSNGLSEIVGLIYQGENSGYQAVGLAHQAGAAKVYLLGFDMKGRHWHGPHPGILNKVNPYPEWIANFSRLAIDCKKIGFDVINCTKDSALKGFPTEDHNKIFGDKDAQTKEPVQSQPLTQQVTSVIREPSANIPRIDEHTVFGPDGHGIPNSSGKVNVST